MVFSLFLKRRGPERRGRVWHMLQTVNHITTNPQTADFLCVAFAAFLYSCQFGVVEFQAGKTRQATSQKPCLLQLETWQCERCNWQVAMCNGQLEIMYSSSWWISTGIHSYQSPVWNMQRLYRWGHGVQARNLPRGFPNQILHAQPHSQINENIACPLLWGGCLRIGIVYVGAVHHICNLHKKAKTNFKKKTHPMGGDQYSLYIIHMGDSLIAFRKPHLKGHVVHRKNSF